MADLDKVIDQAIANYGVSNLVVVDSDLIPRILAKLRPMNTHSKERTIAYIQLLVLLTESKIKEWMKEDLERERWITRITDILKSTNKRALMLFFLHVSDERFWFSLNAEIPQLLTSIFCPTVGNLDRIRTYLDLVMEGVGIDIDFMDCLLTDRYPHIMELKTVTETEWKPEHLKTYVDRLLYLRENCPDYLKFILLHITKSMHKHIMRVPSTVYDTVCRENREKFARLYKDIDIQNFFQWKMMEIKPAISTYLLGCPIHRMLSFMALEDFEIVKLAGKIRTKADYIELIKEQKAYEEVRIKDNIMLTTENPKPENKEDFSGNELEQMLPFDIISTVENSNGPAHRFDFNRHEIPKFEGKNPYTKESIPFPLFESSRRNAIAACYSLPLPLSASDFWDRLAEGKDIPVTTMEDDEEEEEESGVELPRSIEELLTAMVFGR